MSDYHEPPLERVPDGTNRGFAFSNFAKITASHSEGTTEEESLMKKSSSSFSIKFLTLFACTAGLLIQSAAAVPQAQSTTTATVRLLHRHTIAIGNPATPPQRLAPRPRLIHPPPLRSTRAGQRARPIQLRRRAPRPLLPPANTHLPVLLRRPRPRVEHLRRLRQLLPLQLIRAPNPAQATPSKTVSPSDIAAAKASGQVWVNTETKVYHKNDKWYGATKSGKFMSEQDAIKAGYHLAKTGGQN